MKRLKIIQVRSTIGSTKRKKNTMIALRLHKIRHSVIHNDTPQIRGMIEHVKELVKVETVM